jgi:hypothetical protein
MIRYMLLASILVTRLCAQDIPVPPKPQDDSPSLEVTMNFIQDALSAEGSVKYVATRHDSRTNQVLDSSTFSLQVSNIVADSQTCTLSYNKTNFTYAPTKYESLSRLPLSGVAKLEVASIEDRSNSNSASQGHPENTFIVSPPMYEIVVSMIRSHTIKTHSRKSDGDKLLNENDAEFLVEVFYFKTEEMAHRIAKAMVHAVELCGGGSKDSLK